MCSGDIEDIDGTGLAPLGSKRSKRAFSSIPVAVEFSKNTYFFEGTYTGVRTDPLHITGPAIIESVTFENCTFEVGAIPARFEVAQVTFKFCSFRECSFPTLSLNHCIFHECEFENLSIGRMQAENVDMSTSRAIRIEIIDSLQLPSPADLWRLVKRPNIFTSSRIFPPRGADGHFIDQCSIHNRVNSILSQIVRGNFIYRSLNLIFLRIYSFTTAYGTNPWRPLLQSVILISCFSVLYKNFPSAEAKIWTSSWENCILYSILTFINSSPTSSPHGAIFTTFESVLGVVYFALFISVLSSKFLGGAAN